MFIDSMSRQPVYEQIVDQVEQMILSGLMRPGEQLPSVRSLSLELSINPNTIQKAYAELDGRGIIYTLPGRGGFVSQNAPELLAEVPEDEVLACVRSAYVESRL